MLPTLVGFTDIDYEVNVLQAGYPNFVLKPR